MDEVPSGGGSKPDRDNGVRGEPGRAPVVLPALTSLRGLAAVTIVLYHSGRMALHWSGSIPPVILGRGYLAVDLFFFLSGFVLTHVYGARFASGPGWKTLGGFLWARFCRIYPTNFFVTVVLVLVYANAPRTALDFLSFRKQLIAALLLIQVPWFDPTSFNSPSWSISAECYAYLLFPFVVPAILGLSRRTAIIAGVVVLAAVVASHAAFASRLGWGEANWGWGALSRALAEFTAGAFAYRLYRSGHFRDFWSRDAAFLAVTVAICGGISAGLPDAFIAILLLPLLLAAVGNEGRIKRLLAAAPLRRLGDISYSVYIFQAVAFLPVVFAFDMLPKTSVSAASGPRRPPPCRPWRAAPWCSAASRRRRGTRCAGCLNVSPPSPARAARGPPHGPPIRRSNNRRAPGRRRNPTPRRLERVNRSRTLPGASRSGRSEPNFSKNFFEMKPFVND